MARTELTVQEIDRDGIDPTYGAAATDGHAFDNDGHRIFAHVQNGGGGAITVTFQTQGSVDGIAIPDKTVSVGAGADQMIGPFPHNLYCKADSTLSITPHAVWVDYSGVTSVTIAILKLGQASY